MAILITGGAGYIGSHTMVEFLEAGRELVVVDNFLNSKPESLERVRRITGKDFKFYQVDLLLILLLTTSCQCKRIYIFTSAFAQIITAYC